jgi:hypothetical protein
VARRPLTIPRWRANGTIDINQAAIYAEYVEAGLGNSPARAKWRELMTTLGYFFQSEAAQKVRAEARQEGLQEGRQEGRQEGHQEGRQEGRQEGLQEGRVEGRALAILRVLEFRGIAVPEQVSSRILSCSDDERLDAWLNRALDVSHAEAIFAEG